VYVPGGDVETVHGEEPTQERELAEIVVRHHGDVVSATLPR